MGWETRMNQDLRDRLPTLQSANEHADSLRKVYYRTKGDIVVRNLKKNGFDAYYAEDRGEAADLLFQLIPSQSTIGCGDSHTLFDLQIEDRLRVEKKCDLISHRCALNVDAAEHPAGSDLLIGTKEEMQELLIRYLISDVFLLGANAITLDGQIVNCDGRGNRVVGGIYGPRRSIVVAGMNKVTPDLPSAKERIGFIAAPMNNLKYGQELACVKSGKCMDCKDTRRICNITTVIHRKPENADYHVILVGEELGF